MKRHPIRFGVQAAPQQASWAELREVWQEVEALGFDTLWVNDHLLPSVGSAEAPNLEGWTMLSAMAAVTARAGQDGHDRRSSEPGATDPGYRQRLF